MQLHFFPSPLTPPTCAAVPVWLWMQGVGGLFGREKSAGCDCPPLCDGEFESILARERSLVFVFVVRGLPGVFRVLL